MILRDLKTYLVARRRVSLDDLVCRFAVEPDALRAMLAHWIAKGRIRVAAGGQPAAAPACGGCTGCPSRGTAPTAGGTLAGEMYEWLG